MNAFNFRYRVWHEEQNRFVYGTDDRFDAFGALALYDADGIYDAVEDKWLEVR